MSNQYALLKYNRTNNIGDEIQSIAAKRLLPRVDTLVDRDRLSEFHPKTMTKLICNGWFTHSQECFFFNENIDPLLVSFHITPVPGLQGLSVSFAETIRDVPEIRKLLARFGPVGARDICTWKLLQDLGVDSYFSGCLTLTLERSKYKSNGQIVLVDVDQTIAAHVRRISDREILFVRHEFNQRVDSETSFALAERALRTYARAHLVITSRLHAAMPCLAMGIPVIMVGNQLSDTRFSGLVDLCNHRSIEDFLRFEAVQLEHVEPNPARHLAIRAELMDRVQYFLASDPGARGASGAIGQGGSWAIARYFDKELQSSKEMVQTLANEKAQLATEVAQARDEQAQSLEAMKDRDIRHAEMERVLSAVTSDRDSQSIRLADVEACRDSLAAQVGEYQQKLAATEADLEEHSRVFLAQQNENRTAMHNLTALEAERDTLITQLDERFRELGVYVARADALGNRLIALSADLQAAERQAAEFRGQAAEASAMAEREIESKKELSAHAIDTEAALAAKTALTKLAGLIPIVSYLIARKQRKVAKRLIAAGLIEPEFYLSQLPQTFLQRGEGAPLAVAMHYADTGFCTGVLPNPLFDSRWYLERYEDVRRAGVNPLLHYHVHGWREGRDPGPKFQTEYYLSANPDVRISGKNPLTHYLLHGRQEGRRRTSGLSPG